MKKKSFSFIGDVIDLNGRKSISLFDGYIIKKASREQQKYIKRAIESHHSTIQISINRYEYESVPDDENRVNFNSLEEKDWKYHIIEHTSPQIDSKVPLCLALSHLDLTILFQCIYILGLLQQKELKPLERNYGHYKFLIFIMTPLIFM